MSGANGSGISGLDALRARIDEIDESMVALFAEHEGDFDFGTVAQHHTAVVSGFEIGVE